MENIFKTTVWLKRIQRRDFLKALALGVLAGGFSPEAMARSLQPGSPSSLSRPDDYIADYLHKMKFFNVHYDTDLRVSQKDYRTFQSTVMRMRRIEKFVGHGNFQVLSFNSGLRVARRFSQVGGFTRAEIRFLEKIFYREAGLYGFFGKKPLKSITDRIRKTDVLRDSASGSYLYRGQPFETFTEIRKRLGSQVILTSGVRSIMKQFLLFLNKAYKNDGNLSLASRSLAPPGYSYHGIGDFDVGQVGFGAANFTERFTSTEVCKKLRELGYLQLRYPENNLLGVRFEPWHIKIIPDV